MPAVETSHDWRSVVLYALGVGAKRQELDWLYEGRGPRVLPTFAVVPSFGPVQACLATTGVDLAQIVHGAQSVRLRAPIPAEATLVFPLDQAAALIELTTGGKHPVALPGGEQRTWLEDGDSVVLRGWCEKDGAARIGFGECVGTVLPART